jgi:geranylgeranyl diphosphate synthase type I
MMTEDWLAALTPHREAIEAGLREMLATPHLTLAVYYDMMRYHLGWVDAAGQPVQASPGKRLRPLMCPVAVGVELLHNFSLIHDDVEDGDETRRHRPTVWKVWGVPHAINAGDGMFILAHQAIQRLAGDDRVPFDVLNAVYHRFEATCLALCQGQFLDMSLETRPDVTLADYVTMVQGKTASLFAATLEMGALLGADGPATAAQYGAFGMELGLAFQVQDDVLGIWGDPATTGKPAANDLRQRKKSWPVVYALERATGPARQALRATYAHAQLSEADVARVLGLLDGVGARQQAEALVVEHHARALAVLDRAGGREPAPTWLRGLAGALVGREA